MKISHRAEDKHVFTLEQADRIDSLIRRALIKGKSLKNIPDAAVLALLESWHLLRTMLRLELLMQQRGATPSRV
jgi:hypothetical protein